MSADVGDILDVDEAAPITEAQWQRILEPLYQGGKRRLFRILVKPEQRLWAGKRAAWCLNCQHISDVKGDPRRGFCLVQKRMRSNAFPVLCPQYATDL